jgi:hypothetical protein
MKSVEKLKKEIDILMLKSRRAPHSDAFNQIIYIKCCEMAELKNKMKQINAVILCFFIMLIPHALFVSGIAQICASEMATINKISCFVAYLIFSAAYGFSISRIYTYILDKWQKSIK